MKNSKTRQLLIESCEIVSKPKLSCDLKESIKLSAGKAGTLIVKNVPATVLNRRNANGRIYSTDVMQAAINQARPLMERKQLLSQACEHPEGSFVSPTTASHVVTNAYIKKDVNLEVEGEKGTFDVLFMDWEVLNTDEGKNLRALLEAECSIGTSIRGTGDLNGIYVEDYELLGVDIVGLPSSGTYTRMPIAESVQVSLVPENSLKENFTLTTSSTNVVRDLEAAANIQEKLDNIGYGTVTKTSTKVDEETDSKTGAQTSITTLEAETSDDVATLDQALVMAKNAMTNGVVNVDSITIEAIKDEQPKESTVDQYAPLQEDGSIKESSMIIDKSDSGRYELSWNKGEPYTIIDTKTHKIIYSNSNKELIEKHFKKLKKDDTKEGIEEAVLDAVTSGVIQDQFSKDNQMKEAKEENKNAGRDFVLKAPNGFVAMEGNALTFVDDPKDALHFIDGKEESGLVHLSGVEKILDTMGVLDVEKYYRKDTTDISAPDTVADYENELKDANILDGTPANNIHGQAQTNASLSEDNGSNTRYVARVSVEGPGGAPEITTIPVSATEMDSILAEVSNLWEQKSQATRGHVDINVIDTTNNEEFMYNPVNNTLDNLGMQEATDEIKQKDNELSIELDNDHTVTKDFDTTAQASIAKAGLEQGKLPGDIMLSEDDKERPRYQDVPEYQDYTPGWYVGANGVGVTGPFKSKEEALAGMDGIKDFVDAFYLDPNEEGEEVAIDEKLFKHQSEPSDPYVDEPLTDSVKENVEITIDDIDWDIEPIIRNAGSAEELEKMIDNLPDCMTYHIKMIDLPDITLPQNAEEVKKIILDAINKQSSLKINNFQIVDIN